MLVYVHVAPLGCFTGAKVRTISFRDQYPMKHLSLLAQMLSIKELCRNAGMKWPVCQVFNLSFSSFFKLQEGQMINFFFIFIF